MVFVAIPRDILKKIYHSARGDQKVGANEKIIHASIVGLYGWLPLAGLLAKADIYTDILLAMEIYSCDIWWLFAASITVFVFSISYQIYSYIKCFFKISLEKSIYPVPEQTARLLM